MSEAISVLSSLQWCILGVDMSRIWATSPTSSFQWEQICTERLESRNNSTVSRTWKRQPSNSQHKIHPVWRTALLSWCFMMLRWTARGIAYHKRCSNALVWAVHFPLKRNAQYPVLDSVSASKTFDSESILGVRKGKALKCRSTSAHAVWKTHCEISHQCPSFGRQPGRSIYFWKGPLWNS